MYYISKVSLELAVKYAILEKLANTLLITIRNLRPQFQCHTIKVVMVHPLSAILHKPNLVQRLTLWVIEMGKFNICYVPRVVMKSQVMANFFPEFSTSEDVDETKRVKMGTKEEMPI